MKRGICLYWSSLRTRDTNTFCRSFSSGAVTTCFYNLGMSLLGFEHPTFRLQGHGCSFFYFKCYFIVLYILSILSDFCQYCWTSDKNNIHVLHNPLVERRTQICAVNQVMKFYFWISLFLWISRLCWQIKYRALYLCFWRINCVWGVFFSVLQLFHISIIPYVHMMSVMKETRKLSDNTFDPNGKFCFLKLSK